MYKRQVGEQQVEEKITKIEMKSNDEILMSKVMKTINDHLADPTLNVEMLAANVGMSRVHICLLYTSVPIPIQGRGRKE